MELFLLTVREVTQFDPRQMIPYAALLIFYMGFGQTTILGTSGFVWAVALFVALRVPIGFCAGRKAIDATLVGGPVERWIILAVLILLNTCAALILVWLDDPLYAERLFTLLFLILAVALPFTLPTDEEAHESLRWLVHPENRPIAMSVEVLIAVTLAVVNEAAIATGDPGLWVTMRVIGPIIVVPVGHWIALLLIVAQKIEDGE